MPNLFALPQPTGVSSTSSHSPAPDRKTRLKHVLWPARWLPLCAAMILVACGSSVRLDGTPLAPAPAAIAADAAATSTASAAEPAKATSATPGQSQHGQQSAADSQAGSTPSIAQATGITSPTVQEQTLPQVADPDSYATRKDAAALATELAQSLSLDRDWVWTVLSQARYQASVPKLMMPAPTPTAKNWAAYRKRFIEPKRIQAGALFWRTHVADLQRAEQAYGVPAHIVVGILGVETFYGRDMGKYRVLDVLTTLTLDFPSGRSDRSDFFKAELGAFLLMCKKQGLEPTQVVGSFAGAIGWPQFMPSSIAQWAVDFDGDGQINLTQSPIDALGSVARYLSEHGWQKGVATYYSVVPPEASAGLDTLLAPDIQPSFTPADMAAHGAMLSSAGQRHSGLLALVQLHNGGQAPSYVAGTANFYAITRYNQSSYYALAVAQLGEAVSKEVLRQNGHSASGN